MGVTNYRQLKVWQLAMSLAQKIYKQTESFPKHELYGLTSQIRRATVSISLNIAEGHAQDSTKSFLRHISIAMGSLAEVETLVLLAVRLGYFSQEQLDQAMPLLDEIGKMLRGLQKSLRRKRPPSP